MKRLFILRHAKSDWHTAYGGDFDRPLSSRGRRDAERMGEWLQRLGQTPDKVLSSAAVRTRRTVELLTQAGGWACPVEFRQELYDASVETVLRHLQEQNASVSSLLLCGHQPTVSELVERLTGGGSVRFPTAAIARLDLDISTWSQAVAGSSVLAWLVTPKILR
ncbi:MAG: phosphohistidine phosphatase SixA [Deltaproteobacteria bacterium]|nr:phosphohistidine phosphatase SixA [Deltaproteobacteria bacterium]